MIRFSRNTNVGLRRVFTLHLIMNIIGAPLTQPTFFLGIIINNLFYSC